MNKLIKFDTITYDTIKLHGRINEYSLFKNDKLINYNPITDLDEYFIVEWLFHQNNIVRLILNMLKINNIYFPFFKVPRNKFNTAPEKDGDFDLIFHENTDFNQVGCIEFKKIKFEQKYHGEVPKLNGLGNISNLVRQGNIARQTGFHKTIIAVVSELSLSQLDFPNTLMKFNPTNEYQKLYDISNFGSLDSEIGFILIEVSQPTGRGIDYQGVVSSAILKFPLPQKQHSSVTNCYKRLFYKRAFQEKV